MTDGATASEPPAPRPNFFIAGVPKAGTTSLHEYLRQHPQVFMSENKEPHYFVKEYCYGYDNWDLYLQLFKDAGGKKAIGESSAGYSYCEESPSWIKSVLGDVKIIILLRNPAHRAFSLYGWMIREGYEDAPTFAEALRREEHRLHDAAFRAGCPQFFPDYLYFTTGLYFAQVSRYMEIFGRDHVKVFLFEDFVRQPVQTCQEVFRFLELDDSFVPRTKLHNKGRIPRSVALQFRLRTEYLRQYKRPFPRIWLIRLIEGMMSWNVRFGSAPRPDKKLMAALTERYRQDIGLLQNLLGRDLSGWLK